MNLEKEAPTAPQKGRTLEKAGALWYNVPNKTDMIM